MQEALSAPNSSQLPNSAQLRRRGLQVSPQELIEMTLEALAGLQETLYSAEPHRDFTEEEAEALSRGGFHLEPGELGTDDPMARTIAEYAALLDSSLTTSEAAERLGVASSRIRQRLLSKPRTLLGIRLVSGWRLPLFQFENDKLVPGIGGVVANLDPSLHPVAVYYWFTSPNPDLIPEQQEDSLSPRDWLRAGFPPEPVERLAADL